MPTDAEMISAYLSHMQARLWGLEKFEKVIDTKKIKESYLKAVSKLIEHSGEDAFARGFIERFRKDISSLDMRPVMPLHSHYGGDEELVRKLKPEEVSPELPRLLRASRLGIILKSRTDFKTVVTCLKPLFTYHEMWRHIRKNHPGTFDMIRDGLEKNSETRKFLAVKKGEELLPFFKDYKKTWEHTPNKEMFKEAAGKVRELRGMRELAVRKPIKF